MKKYFFAAALATATIFSACDPCKDVECQNSGTCVEGTCECTEGYEGTNCETEERAKFLNDAGYTFSDNDGTNTFTGTLTVAKSSTNVSAIVITNFGGFDPTGSVIGTANNQTLTFATQTIGGVTVAGSGTLSASGTQITGTYTSTDANGTVTNTFTWTKK